MLIIITTIAITRLLHDNSKTAFDAFYKSLLQFPLTNIDKEVINISLNNNIKTLEKEHSITNMELSTADKKLSLLDQVPCGNSFPTCKFIKDAFAAKDAYADLKTDAAQKGAALQKLVDKIASYDEVSDTLTKIRQIQVKKSDTINKIHTIELKIEKNKIYPILLNSLFFSGSLNRFIHSLEKK